MGNKVEQLLRENEKLRKLIAKRKQDTIVAVDFDGTLATLDKWDGYNKVGKPIKKTVAKIKALKKQGAFVIIHSCRITTASNKVFLYSLNVVRKWLKKHKIEYDDIWISNGKPYANYYLDDNAINPNCKECWGRFNETHNRF